MPQIYPLTIPTQFNKFGSLHSTNPRASWVLPVVFDIRFLLRFPMLYLLPTPAQLVQAHETYVLFPPRPAPVPTTCSQVVPHCIPDTCALRSTGTLSADSILAEAIVMPIRRETGETILELEDAGSLLRPVRVVRIPSSLPALEHIGVAYL